VEFDFVAIRNYLLSLFFPRKCVSCGAEGYFLCERCFSFIEKTLKRISVPNLDGVFALYRYERGGVLQKAVKAIKYRFLREVAEVFRDDLFDFLDKNFSRDEYVLAAVPLHPKREKWRGFNQAEELVSGIDWPRFKGLKRVRYTEAQAEKSRAQRLANLEGAFKVDLTGFLNKKFILIDDVCTTGSTLSECARVLRAAGAKEVVGVVLGHG